MPTPFEIMEAERKRRLDEADQVEKDMRDFERIVQKYGFRVVADPESFTPVNRERVIPSLREEAEGIIRTRGHPLDVHEIVEIMLERGSELAEVRDPRAILVGNLIKNPRLKYYPKLGWWLRDVSWPPKPEELRFIHNPPPTNGPRKHRRTPEKERLYTELRKLLEGKAEPTPFSEIFDHIKGLGIPAGGTNEKANLSVFMQTVHEFRSHGPSGKGGWTFVADKDWSFTDGFKGDAVNDPAWRHNPLQRKIFEALRDILKPIAPERIPLPQLLESIKGRGIEFKGVEKEVRYLRRVLGQVQCFDFRKHQGWRYIPELDDDSKPATS